MGGIAGVFSGVFCTAATTGGVLAGVFSGVLAATAPATVARTSSILPASIVTSCAHDAPAGVLTSIWCLPGITDCTLSGVTPSSARPSSSACAPAGSDTSVKPVPDASGSSVMRRRVVSPGLTSTCSFHGT